MKLKQSLVVLVALCLLSGVLIAQDLRIRQVLDNPGEYKDEVVAFVGTATEYIEGDATTTSFYLLKDDWGGIIKVRTSQAKPEVGIRYEVKGVVGLDPVEGDVYLSEESRRQLSVIPPAPKEDPWYKKNIIYILGGAIVIVLIILALLVKSVLNKKPALDDAPGQEEQENIGNDKAALSTAEMIEGKTVKIAVPPAGTLKLLPGRFIVTSGDDAVKEIRFYKLKAQDENEITFGRAAGNAFNHVQLKSMTVSAKHAKVIYAGNKYTVINYSGTNPAKINGKELAINGSQELKDGDRLELGEVVFEFRAK